MHGYGPRRDNADQLEQALARLHEIVLDGLRHGFLECMLSCELIKEEKRRFEIAAGKCHQFVIAEDDLLEPDLPICRD